MTEWDKIYMYIDEQDFRGRGVQEFPSSQNSQAVVIAVITSRRFSLLKITISSTTSLMGPEPPEDTTEGLSLKLS